MMPRVMAAAVDAAGVRQQMLERDVAAPGHPGRIEPARDAFLEIESLPDHGRSDVGLGDAVERQTAFVRLHHLPASGY